MKIACLLTLLLASPICFTQTTKIDRTTLKIQTIYDQAGTYLIRQDLKDLVKYFQETRTQDYVYISSKGVKHPLTDMLRSMAMVFSSYRIVRTSVHIDQLKSSGSSAMATVTTRIEMVPKMAGHRTTHTVGQEVHGIDTWTRVGDNWKLKLSKVSSESVLQDGKRLHD